MTQNGDNDGYTVMKQTNVSLTQTVSFNDEDEPTMFDRSITPEQGAGSLTQANSTMSMAEEHEHEIEVLQRHAERDSQEYADIVACARNVEDVSCDVWGALIFVVAGDLPDWRSGRIMFEGKCRMAYVFFVFFANLLIQGTLLFFILKLLLMPSLLSAQDVYKDFHEEAFTDEELDQDRFKAMSVDEKNNLCGMALSQVMFCRVIIFLWASMNVGELRDTCIKMFGALSLPKIPAGLDTRLMQRNLDASSCDNNIICLNMKTLLGLMILVFIPKILIASVLMVTGCVWLMASENIGDLILNSLALAFVVRVDELLAQVFFPEHFLEMVDDLAFVLPKHGEIDKDVQMRERAREFMMCALTLLMTLVAVEALIQFQPILPNQSHDITSACRDYVNSQVPWCMPWQTDCFPKT